MLPAYFIVLLKVVSREEFMIWGNILHHLDNYSLIYVRLYETHSLRVWEFPYSSLHQNYVIENAKPPPLMRNLI